MSFKNKSPIISRQSDASEDEDYWLKNLSNALEKEAVQPRRVDQNLFEQINSIMNNKSKYTSVEAAVEDMKSRSGLTAYLDKIKQSSDKVHLEQVKKASNNQNELLEKMKDAYKNKNWKLLGIVSGQFEKSTEDNANINAVEFIRIIKYFKDSELSGMVIPIDNWIDFTIGYGEGQGFSKENKDADLKFTKDLIEMIKSKRSKSNQSTDNNNAFDKKIKITPIIFEKNPSIKNTLENYIRDTRGNLSVPAIIDKIKSIHRTDVAEDKDWDDDKLLKFVSDLNLEAKKNNPQFNNYNNLGSRDYTNNSDIDIANTDAFHGLSPVKF